MTPNMELFASTARSKLGLLFADGQDYSVQVVDMDNRAGEPTQALDIEGFFIYTTPETDERGRPLVKWAVDATVIESSRRDEPPGGTDYAEVGLHNSFMEALRHVAVLIVERAFEGSHYDDLADELNMPDESMDGDHESALRDAGMGTDEDYGDFDSWRDD